MKKLLQNFLVLCLTAGVAFSTTSPIFADVSEIHYDTSNISENYSELDEYVTVRDNQYVLNLPSHITLSADLEEKVNTTIEETNKTISELRVDINEETKEAIHYTIDTDGLTRAYGVSSISLSWNSIILKVSAGMLRSIAGVVTGIAAGSTVAFVAAKIAPFWPALSKTILNNGWSVQFIVGLGADIISGKLYQNVIRHGIEIHYNFLMFHFTVFRFQ